MSKKQAMSETPRLNGKVALITGAASGIGAEHAKLFAREGARVMLADIQSDAGQEVASAIRSSGGAADFVELNVSDENAWQQAVAKTLEAYGRLTTLVNIAGVPSFLGLEAETAEGWDKTISINQTGTWLGMKTALPALVESGNAAIVNISSMMAIKAATGAFAYQAAKSAIIQMTRAAALEYAAKGVRVNCISPGLIETPMLGERNDDRRAAMVQAIPLKRLGQPQEIANCSLFLCSDDAAYVTGTNLLADGGSTLA